MDLDIRVVDGFRRNGEILFHGSLIVADPGDRDDRVIVILADPGIVAAANPVILALFQCACTVPDDKGRDDGGSGIGHGRGECARHGIPFDIQMFGDIALQDAEGRGAGTGIEFPVADDSQRRRADFDILVIEDRVIPVLRGEHTGDVAAFDAYDRDGTDLIARVFLIGDAVDRGGRQAGRDHDGEVEGLRAGEPASPADGHHGFVVAGIEIVGIGHGVIRALLQSHGSVRIGGDDSRFQRPSDIAESGLLQTDVTVCQRNGYRQRCPESLQSHGVLRHGEDQAVLRHGLLCPVERETVEPVSRCRLEKDGDHLTLKSLRGTDGDGALLLIAERIDRIGTQQLHVIDRAVQAGRALGVDPDGQDLSLFHVDPADHGILPDAGSGQPDFAAKERRIADLRPQADGIFLAHIALNPCGQCIGTGGRSDELADIERHRHIIAEIQRAGSAVGGHAGSADLCARLVRRQRRHEPPGGGGCIQILGGLKGAVFQLVARIAHRHCQCERINCLSDRDRAVDGIGAGGADLPLQDQHFVTAPADRQEIRRAVGPEHLGPHTVQSGVPTELHGEDTVADDPGFRHAVRDRYTDHVTVCIILGFRSAGLEITEDLQGGQRIAVEIEQAPVVGGDAGGRIGG